MTWQEFVTSVNDSHPMTTAREHIAKLCEVVAGQAWRIAELGSHVGISAAAMAIAAPKSAIVSVDLCDTVSQESRIAYWHALGITNIQPVQDDAGRFLRQSQLMLERWDFVFHDAVHGEASLREYLTAAGLSGRLAIHDFEQLSEESRNLVRARFSVVDESADAVGRVLFVGLS